MKKKKERKSAGQRLSAFLEVPLDMVADVPRLTVNDNRELTVENYKSIEGYETDEIRLRCKNYRLVISGRNLSIVAITDEEMMIRGFVTGICFD